MLNKKQLKELIKEIIKEELLDEMSTTGATPGYMTPNAFSGGKVKWRGGEYGTDSMPNPHERDVDEVDEEDPAKLDEAYSRYRRFKESAAYKKAPSKVSYVVMEIKKMLKEVDYLVNISNKLKQESDVTTDAMWNRTSKDLMEIDQYVQEISRKAKDLGA
jgi:hypothetical protein